MFRYAQILNGVVHWIFTDEMSLDELYVNKFNPSDITLVDITDNQDVDEGWLYVDGEFVSPTPARTLDDAKADAWTRIKLARDKAEQGGFAYLGKTIDSDEKSALRITAAANAAQSGDDSFTLDWTCADNTTLTMTAADAIGMGTAMAVWSNSCHQKARAYRDQIAATTTIADADAVSWA